MHVVCFRQYGICSDFTCSMTEEIMLVDDLVFPELESGFVCIEEHCVGDVIEHVCIFI